MNNRKKSTFKIISGVVAIALIGGILFVTNAFMGNPISAMMANKAIEKYMDENYSFLDLEIEKARYNFKDGSYMARAKSRTSIDTKFAIYYRDGKVQRDDYENYVLGMFNTLQRFSEEYSAIAKDIIARELGYEDNTTMVLYNKRMYGTANDALELDMKFDKSLPLEAEVLIRLDLTDSSLERVAKILTDAHKAFLENDCYFMEYGLSAEGDGTYVSVYGVTPAHIESGELITLLKDAKNNDHVGGVSVFIK